MRIDVEKFLIAGPWSARDAFFKEIQARSMVEFIPSKAESREVPQNIQMLTEALHILRQMVPVKQIPGADYKSANVLARDIVEINEELEKSLEQARYLRKEIARIEVFGDFSIDDLNELQLEAHRKIQFYFCKKPELLEAPKKDEVIEIGQAYGLHYFIAINREPTSYDGLIEMKIERSLGELQQELAEVIRKKDLAEDKLSQLAHQKKLLKQGLADALNHAHLDQSTERAASYLEGGLFGVEAWVPKDRIKELHELAEKQGVYAEQILIEKKDRTPTHLKNKNFGRLGEDLVGIYDTPSTTDRDPSLWVFSAFAVFFSMIVADAGYGIILLLISLFMLKKFGKLGGLARRVLLLGTYLSVGCIIWGVMMPSFLGIEFAPDSKFRKLSPIGYMTEKKAEYVMHAKGSTYKELEKRYPKISDAKTPMAFLMAGVKEKDGHLSYPIYKDFEDAVLLELAIFIGTLHLMFSFLRYLDKNWAALGWAIFMIGAYLYFPQIVKATSLVHYVFGVPKVAGAEIGFYLIWIGLGLAQVLAIIQKRLKGIGELMHVIGVFADVMSYLRIYALALASMIMAHTFDEIGINMPIYIGIFVILIGHTINFILSLMGGIIHGLRLNFIEWYHYSFEGGGKWFNPLSLLKVD